MARFLIDESLPRAVGRALVAAGHDVIDARDVGLRGAPDDEVMARAIADARTVVAGDTDFANRCGSPQVRTPESSCCDFRMNGIP